MQRKVLQGVPYWVDAQNKIYAYTQNDTTYLCLGTYSPETEKVTLLPNWKELYTQKLMEYRTSAQARARLPVANP
jgi:hypothetical protein